MGLKVYEAAELFGYSRQHWSKFENDDPKAPIPKVLERATIAPLTDANPIDCTISIARSISGSEGHSIIIEIIEPNRLQRISMSVEQFGFAITGLTERPATIKTNNIKTRESTNSDTEEGS